MRPLDPVEMEQISFREWEHGAKVTDDVYTEFEV